MNASLARIFQISLCGLTLAACAVDGGGEFRSAQSARAAKATVAPTEADGPWRVGVEISSFEDGKIGRIDGTVEVVGGGFRSGFRQGDLNVAMTVSLAGGRAKGQMAVTPGINWNTVSIPFEGPVVDGALQLDLTGVVTGDGFGGIWRRNQQARALYVKFRLQKQPAS